MKINNIIIVMLIVILSFLNTTVNAQNIHSNINQLANNNQSQSNNNTQSTTQSSTEPYYFDKNCSDLGPALRIGNLIIRIVRVAVPFIIIVLGTFKLGSAALSGSSGDLGKVAIDLFKRVIIAALIFFTPSIINGFMKVMTPDENADVNICRQCLFENNCPEIDDVLTN